MQARSPNFAFLQPHEPRLLRYAAQAERYFADDANTCLIKLRQFAEVLALEVAAASGVHAADREDLIDVLRRLYDQGVVTAEVSQLFHGLRKAGNAAVHQHADVRREALHQLRVARELAAWFHRGFGGAPSFKAGPFIAPPNPADGEAALLAELDRLREVAAEHERVAHTASHTAAEEARLRAEAERRAETAYGDLKAAMDLAEETAQQAAADRARFEAHLATVQATASSSPAATAATVQAAVTAATHVVLDEPATRRIIDQQLRDAGWEADTDGLRYSKGARPAKGRNLAIAEWPTSSGPVDYALFVGLAAVGVIEAKKKNTDVLGVLDSQGLRYSRDFLLDGDAVYAGGPWGEFRVPFVFATNSRPFLEQLRTRSGIWHRDVRRSKNPSHPLVAWKTPAGLISELTKDVDAAHQALAVEPTDYLGLRDYQINAIAAAERAIERGDQRILLAMATGTGKTKTCVGLCYRLLKTGRFRRILFLVDRTSLGDQAFEVFSTSRLEGPTFTDTYEVLRIGDAAPGPTTKLHFATVQGMVRRLFYADGDPLPVDAYDCVIVDESHRGYLIDRDMSPGELTFRDQSDYVSKYTRVLDWFDAVKVALTATPALHTVQIFGPAVFTYGYRDAVIDGWLCDHEPPYHIRTALQRSGIRFVANEPTVAYNVVTQETSSRVPDQLAFDVDEFNKSVITRSFNEAVASELVNFIDPLGDGKTLVFAVDDAHADMLVDVLRAAYRVLFPDEFEDGLIAKITGRTDRPGQAIRNFRNERAPNIAVTVDLLSTGVDVPRICNIVFVRRVSSRILYEQMLGRATRLCDEIGKQTFRIFDAVDLYSALLPYSAMKPVVVNPQIPFAQLAEELTTLIDDALRSEVRDQIVARLQRKKRSMNQARMARFIDITGDDVSAAIARLRAASSAEAADWWASHPSLAAFLDEPEPQRDRWLPVYQGIDTPQPTVQGFPDGKDPGEYLAGFRAYVESHKNDIPALLVVTTKPRDLTRKQLRELRLALDQAGYGERTLQAAWAARTNQEIAASIVGFIRQQALGSPLKAYAQRVDDALNRVLTSRTWTRPQKDWLTKIAAQLKVEVVVDAEAFEIGAFKSRGGFRNLDRVFDGHLSDVLGELHDAVWKDVG